MPFPASYFDAVSQSLPTQWWRLNDPVGSTTASNYVSSSNVGVLGANVEFTGASPDTLAGPTSGSYYNWYTQSTQSLALKTRTTSPTSAYSCSLSGVLKDEMDVYVPWTVELWYRPANMGGYEEIIGKYGAYYNTNKKGWGIYAIDNNVHMSFYIASGSVSGSVISTYCEWQKQYLHDSWIHLVIVNDPPSGSVPSSPNYQTLYINAASQGTGTPYAGATIPASSTMQNTSSFVVGAWTNIAVGPSAWQEVAFYNRALSQSEILQHFQSSYSTWSASISSSTAMDSGTIPSGTYHQIQRIGPFSMYSVQYSSGSTGGSGSRGRPTKTNPGVN
jgi:hypothetical protein